MWRAYGHPFVARVAILILVSGGIGCQQFSAHDAAQLTEYGGGYIPGGEGPGHYWFPVETIYFDAAERALSDADFAAAFATVQRMNPYLLRVRELRAKSLRQLYVSPDAFSEADISELRSHLAGVQVHRFRAWNEHDTTLASELAPINDCNRLTRPGGAIRSGFSAGIVDAHRGFRRNLPPTRSRKTFASWLRRSEPTC